MMYLIPSLVTTKQTGGRVTRLPDPNCYQPIHCIRSLSELFSRLISNQTQDTIVQQEEDSPEELVPPPTEFRTSESTAYPEWSDTDPYTIPTDNDEVFYYVMCGK